MTNNNIFPKIKKSIDSFIQDEDGSIPRGKLVTLGTFFLLMSTIIGAEAFGHSSHKSHSSHRSHSSHSSGSHSSGGGHGSHVSHSSHTSSSHGSHSSYSHNSHSSHSSSNVTHSNHNSHYNVLPTATHYSHGSHTSHSNTTSHSNSQYSARGDLLVTPAPDISGINGIGKLFELDRILPDDMDVPQEPVISVLVPNTGIKGAAPTQSLMDVPVPELQTPNESPSISTTIPALQVFPDSKNTGGNGE